MGAAALELRDASPTPSEAPAARPTLAWALLGLAEVWRLVLVLGPVRRLVVMVPGQGEERVGFDVVRVHVLGEGAPREIAMERLEPLRW